MACLIEQDQTCTRIFVRVISNIKFPKAMTFEAACEKYKNILKIAQSKNCKQSVLFDLSRVTVSMLNNHGDKLKKFFTSEINELSESTLLKCIIVVNCQHIKNFINLAIKAFPGSIPTTVQCEIPQ